MLLRLLFLHIALRIVLALPLNSPLLPSYDYIGKSFGMPSKDRDTKYAKWSVADRQA